MTDMLSAGPLCVDEIVDMVRVQSRDQENNPVFQTEDIKLALRQAVLNSHHRFFLTSSYEFTFSAGTREYTLPDYIERIIFITQEPGALTIPNTLNNINFDRKINSWRHINKGHGANKLYFTRDFFAGTMEVFYERDVPVPLDNRILNGAHSNSILTLALTDASPQLWRLSLPAEFKVGEEIVTATAITANTSLTVTRGSLGSTAAAQVTGATVSQVVRADSDRFYNFLFAEMGRLLNMWRVQSAAAGKDVSGNLTAARMFSDDKTTIGREQSQPKHTRQMKFSRTRRPRRGI